MAGPSLHTPGLAGFGLAFSPFVPNRLALASSTNFGLVGNGRVSVLADAGPSRGLQLEQKFETKDAVHAVAWSELHPGQVASAGGDGSVKLWDVGLPGKPIVHWHEHRKEATSVDWSNVQKDRLASASWDGTVLVWTPERKESVATLSGHDSHVHAVSFSPHSPSLVGSASAAGLFALHDLRSPALAPPQLALRAFGPGVEALSADFNKYDAGVVGLSGTDRTVRVVDLRGGGGGGPGGARREVARGEGHAFPARVVRWSPWRRDALASAGYDMTVRLWSTVGGAPGQARQVGQHTKHTEFVCGLAWSLFTDNVLASCGWDGMVHSWVPPPAAVS